MNSIFRQIIPLVLFLIVANSSLCQTIIYDHDSYIKFEGIPYLISENKNRAEYDKQGVKYFFTKISDTLYHVVVIDTSKRTMGTGMYKVTDYVPILADTLGIINPSPPYEEQLKIYPYRRAKKILDWYFFDFSLVLYRQEKN